MHVYGVSRSNNMILDFCTTPTTFMHAIKVLDVLAECAGVYNISDTDAKECFDIYCDHGQGLSIDALGDALRSIGFNPLDDEIEALKLKYDRNADGKIDEQAWVEMINELRDMPKVRTSKDNLFLLV